MRARCLFYIRAEKIKCHFFTPRTITILRPAAQTGVGSQEAYAAGTSEGETVVISGVKAVRVVNSSTSTTPTIDVTKDTSTTAPAGALNLAA
jgi:hypothetical protein